MNTGCSSEQLVWFGADIGDDAPSGFAVFMLAARKLRASCPACLANEWIPCKGTDPASDLHFCSQLRWS